MLRRTSLIAAVALSLGATGAATISAAAPASARPASASAVRVTTPCDGAGIATLIAHRTASGGTFAKTKLTGLKRRQWIGATLVTGPAHILDDMSAALGVSADGDYTPPETKYAQHGTLTESVTSPRTWPHLGASLYFSNGGDLCSAVVQVRPHGIMAGGADTEVDVRPQEGVIRAADYVAAPKTRWRVTVSVWTPAGAQTETQRVRVGKDGLDLRFTGFKALSTYTKVRLRAVSLKTHQVQRLTLSRTV